MIYFLAIFTCSLVVSVLIAQIMFYFVVLGFNISNSLTLMIFHKALKHPLLASKQYSIGDIINYS